MIERKHKPRWGLIVGLGIFAIAVGIFINTYAIVVVENGPFPAKSGGFQISGFFFIGLGIGYVVCAPAVKQLEKKIRNLEDKLDPKSP
jgi:hypothetical protein